MFLSLVIDVSALIRCYHSSNVGQTQSNEVLSGDPALPWPDDRVHLSNQVD